MHSLTLAIAVTGGRYLLIMKKDSSVGKGYSYFFAFMIIGLMGVQTIRIEIEFPQQNVPEIKSFSIEEIPQVLAIAQISLIAYLLGVPTDGIATKIAKFLDAKFLDNEDRE